MEPLARALPPKRSKDEVRHAVDLLWIHQVRRENKGLQQEVKSLQEAFRAQNEEHRSLEDVARRAEAAAVEATASVRTVLTAQASLRSEAETAKQEILEAKEQHEIVEARLADQENSTNQPRNDFAQLQEECLRSQRGCVTHHSEVDSAIDELASNLDTKADRQAVHELHKKLEELVSASRRRSVSRVEDSVEDGACGAATNNASQRSVHFEPKDRLEQTASRRRGPQEQASETMLSLRPGCGPREATASEDIDLDQNVTLMSYAGNLTGKVAGEEDISTFNLEAPRGGFAHAELENLRQGRFQSWETYLLRGQALFPRIPRRQESHLVEKFVDGLYSEAQRQQCCQWLDLSGWTWSSVASFGFTSTPCVPTQLGARKDTAAQLPSRHAAHEPGAERVQVPMGDRVPKLDQRSLIDSVDDMLAGSAVDREGPHPRRSQRIEVQQNVSPESATAAATANTHSKIEARRSNARKTKANSNIAKVQSRAISNRRPRDGHTGRFLPSQAEPPTQQSASNCARRRSKPHKANSKARTTIKKTEKVAKPKQQPLPPVVPAPKLPEKQSLPSKKPSVAQTKVRLAEQRKSASKQHLTQRSDSPPSTPVNPTSPRGVVTSDSPQIVRAGRQRKVSSIDDDASVFDFPRSPRMTGVERKRKASDIFNDDELDRPRRSDDVELPAMPLYFGKPVVESHRRNTKKRRLPLPPPPPIPILPTSED